MTDSTRHAGGLVANAMDLWPPTGWPIRKGVATTDTPGPNCCKCDWSNSRDHDWLLGVERRGLAGLPELFDRWHETIDWISVPAEEGCPDPDDILSVVWDLPDFAGQHRWEDPFTVQRLFRHLVAYGDRLRDCTKAKAAR